MTKQHENYTVNLQEPISKRRAQVDRYCGGSGERNETKRKEKRNESENE